MNAPEKSDFAHPLQTPEQRLLTNFGKQIFSSFEGCTHGYSPSPKLTLFLQNHNVIPTSDGWPKYTLTLPELGGAVKPWRPTPYKGQFDHTATTDTYTPLSPHIIPVSLQNALDIITITNATHFWNRGEDNVLLARSKTKAITVHSYQKGSDPVVIKPLNSLAGINPELYLGLPDNFGATIQLWKLLPAWTREISHDTFELQAAFQLHKISLQKFVEALGSPLNTPLILRKQEE